MFCIAMLGCTKDVTSQPPVINQGDSNVTFSSWFSPAWQYEVTTSNGWQLNAFDRTVPEINADLLKYGKILVFGKGGYEMRPPTALPANFDNAKINVDVMMGDLKFVLINSGEPISPSFQFRYILIPVDQFFPGGFDYDNYSAVCQYYHIFE